MLVARCVCNISWAVTRVNTDILPAGVTPLVCTHHTDNSGALLSTHYTTLRLKQNLLPLLSVVSIFPTFLSFLESLKYPKQGKFRFEFVEEACILQLNGDQKLSFFQN